MARKPVVILIAILIVAVGWIFFRNFRISGLTGLQVVPRGTALETVSNHYLPEAPRPVPMNGGTLLESRTRVQFQGSRVIRIASFNLDSFNETKAGRTEVIDVLVRIVRRFHIVALQEVQSDADDLVPRLTNAVNKLGPVYDFAVGKRLGRPEAPEQYAFVFDKTVVELDRDELYTVDDRDDLMLREPLVGWFRVRVVPPDEAFTFSLVNVHVDPRQAEDELDILDDVMFAVRNDGREEDDVIMAGDFAASYRNMGELSRVADLGWAVSSAPTSTLGDKSHDNIVFQKTPTVEFTGNSGVFDFLRDFNLSMEQARAISEHMPVWAEFSIFEGGDGGRFATSVKDQQTRGSAGYRR
jgi:endonuclease/exonuclease/phosphatase family metal-dependent hydrolase